MRVRRALADICAQGDQAFFERLQHQPVRGRPGERVLENSLHFTPPGALPSAHGLPLQHIHRYAQRPGQLFERGGGTRTLAPFNLAEVGLAEAGRIGQGLQSHAAVLAPGTHGVGAAKVEQFADVFLREIREFGINP